MDPNPNQNKKTQKNQKEPNQKKNWEKPGADSNSK